jgi:hypothetical protein
MKTWKRVSWKRVGIALLILFGVAAVLDWAGRDLLALYFARETAKEEPNLSAVPEPVPDMTVAELVGLHLNRFEYEFQVPWKEVDFERDAKSVVGISFKSGASMMLFDPLSEVGAATEMRGKTASDARKMRQIFGDRALSSNYDFMAEEMAATPSQIKWWNLPRANVRCMILLNLKVLEIHGSSKAIYRQSSEEMHGFQFGDPAAAPYMVELDLFDRHDRRYKILLIAKNPVARVITQAQINAIVASLRPIPHN